MTTKTDEQERAEFEAWRRKHYDYDDLNAFEIEFAFAAYQAGRASLQSQDREDAAMAETLREAAEIIFAIQPEHAPKNIRWPIVDELHGFASMIYHARRVEENK